MPPTSVTREMPQLTLRASFEPSTVNAEKRTVDVTWTTGARVKRGGWEPYFEELSLDPNHVRMGRLQSGAAPLLNAHGKYDISDVLGVVESARLEGNRGVATVRFDSGPAGEDAFRRVREGTLRNVSVGYATHKMQKVEGGDSTTPVYRAVDWEPHELSLVPIGADAGAVTRSGGGMTYPCEFIEERAMPPEPQNAPETKPTTAPVPVAPAPATAAVPAAADVQRAADERARLERERILGIQRAARTLGRPDDEAQRAIDGGMTLDAYRAAAIDARAQAPADKGGPILLDKRDPRIEVGANGHGKWANAISAAIIARCGSEAIGVLEADAKRTGAKLELDPGEFRGMRMLDVARACLDRSGVSHRGMSALEVIGAALTASRSDTDDTSFFTNRAPSQSTGDFPLILENVLHKLLLAQYGLTPDTWRKCCTVGSAVDFRPNPRYRLGSISALDVLTELGEFQNKSFPDAEKQTITVATKGNILALSRQALLNDDMSAFSRIAMAFGRAAALSIESDFYALLAQNSGLGPNLSDGHPVFDATHNNIGTAAALGSNAIDADASLMAAQKDPSGNEILDIQPAVLLLPRTLKGQALQINNGEYDFDALTQAGAQRSTYRIPNKVGNMFRDVVGTARLTGTRRYLLADPAIYPVFETIFLDGQEQPYMEMRQGWRIDGVEWKIRLDYAVGAIDFRGGVTNAGA